MVASQTGRRTQQRYSVNLTVEFTFQGQVFQALSRNMSVGGVFVETTAPLLFDETISLKFALPGLKEPIEAEAQVRWVERQGWERTGVGLQFVGLRAKYVWALNKFLAGKKPAE